MDALIVTLIAWIAAHSDLAAAGVPDIHYVSKLTMGGLYRTANAKNYFRVEAFYIPGKSEIYLADSWRASDLRDRSVLVHELVHHLQAANKIRVPCPAALERQAYDLQFKWLRENGIERPYDFTGLDVLTVILASTCPE